MKSNINKRITEKKCEPYRYGRFYSVANEWYFLVRDEKEQGPFLSKLAAEENLEKYLLNYQNLNSKIN